MLDHVNINTCLLHTQSKMRGQHTTCEADHKTSQRHPTGYHTVKTSKAIKSLFIWRAQQFSSRFDVGDSMLLGLLAF